MRGIAALAVLAALLVLVTAAAAETRLSLTALPTGLRFSQSLLKAKAGLVTITMGNQSPLRHDVAIKGHGVNVKGKIVGRNGISKVSVTLKAGTYTFYCSVPGHAAAGMRGTLKVS